MTTQNTPLCVLVVDDDYHFNTNVLGYHLRSRGFDVKNAYTVLDFENNWPYADVILLDIRLPEKNGDPIDPWGGLKALKRVLAQIPSNVRYPQLENCIIRSAQTETDAIGARIDIPQYFKWFSPDTPYSEVICAVQEVARINRGDNNQ